MRDRLKATTFAPLTKCTADVACTYNASANLLTDAFLSFAGNASGSYWRFAPHRYHPTIAAGLAALSAERSMIQWYVRFSATSGPRAPACLQATLGTL
jgi:hypothetical protein